MIRSAIPISPLRQSIPINHHISKYYQSYLDLFSTPTTTTIPSSFTPRYFNDLFCLKVEPQTLIQLIELIQTQNLFKTSITLLFTNAVRILKEDKVESNQFNVVQTLLLLLRNILGRTYSNYSIDVITLLAGSVSRSDAVFTDLVSAIDVILANESASTSLRHKTLQLALTIVASVGQASIGAYFLRRDLFSTIVKFISDPSTAPLAYESALLLSLLANYQKYSARNPYLVRIEDLVDEVVMGSIIDVVREACLISTAAYINIVDDSPPSFVASLKSLVFSFRISELLSFGFPLSLPALPERSKVCETIPVVEIAEEAKDEPAVPEKKESELISNDGLSTPPASPLPRAKRQASLKNLSISLPPPALSIKPSNPFDSVPPEMIVILLTFYDAFHNNPAFCAMVLTPNPDDPTSFLPPHLISLTSYLVCHASTSVRAGLYARLSLILLTILVEEGEGKLLTLSESSNAREPRLCRQRQPMLPYASSPRPLISSILDTALTFLRHNLRKKLDVGSYILALKLVLKVMQSLRARTVRLTYDWVSLWRSILSLSAFVVSKIDVIEDSSNIDELISQVFIVLSYAAYWGDTFLPSPEDSVQIVYEILHADSVLAAASDLCGMSSVSSPPSTAIPTTTNFDPITASASKPNSQTVFTLPLSKSKSQPRVSRRTGSDNVVFNATEEITNVRLIISFFKSKIALAATSKPNEEEEGVEEVSAVIAANLGSLELLESSRMGEEGESYSEKDHIDFFDELMKMICIDTLVLLQ